MNTSKNKYNIAREAIAIKRDMFLNPSKGFWDIKVLKSLLKSCHSGTLNWIKMIMIRF